MATSLSLENDSSLAQGYIKVNGSTAATLTTIGITGNLVGNVTGNVTGNLTGSLTQGGSLTLATAQTASGTAVDFTGIPSWAKRITVMFSSVSTNGSSEYIVRLGTSSGIQSTGYLSSSVLLSTGVSAINETTGFRVFNNGGASTDVEHGVMIFSLINSASGIWAATGSFCQSDSPRNNIISGSKTLSGTLDRIRITTVNGTDTFDAGTINISYEG
jgi:hypothetical protein